MPDTYEPEGGNTPPLITPTPPAPHHVRPVLLVLLGATIIIALGVVMYIKISIPSPMYVPPEERVATSSTATLNVESVHTTVRKVSGYVVEVLTLNGVEGKRVKIATQIADGDGDTQPVEYAFFISDLIKVGSIQGGDFVTITFEGEPSETEYVVVTKVEQRRP